MRYLVDNLIKSNHLFSPKSKLTPALSEGTSSVVESVRTIDDTMPSHLALNLQLSASSDLYTNRLYKFP